MELSGERMELKFVRLDPSAVLPERAHDNDAGLDLRSLDEVRLGPGERIAARTGLAVEIPPGNAGLVMPRSGLARKHGITIPNSPGLIDSGYRGELTVLLLNTDPAEQFEITRGDRIAQLVVVPITVAAPTEVERLGESRRGEVGFGSTGIS